MIEVVKPGLSTTVQDAGREGHYHVGIPPSGALDQFSLAAANLLVGNPEGASALECAYMGPELRFGDAAVVAVAGAELAPRVDGAEMPLWEAFEVPAGALLSFAHLRGGARAYLAVAGGIDVPEVLGSRSTYTLGSLGGLEGRALAAGDTLAVGGETGRAAGAAVPQALRPAFGTELEIRVVMGLYDHLLADGTFTEATWVLTPVADRVGFRYKGPKLELREREQPFGAGSDPSNIVDAPYPIGSIQIPGGVEPIVLHRDAVSGGGYAMIATVISADMDTVAQSAPGAKTRFVPVTLEEALDARAQRRGRLERLREALA
ncbi:5-oxoprolinase subunit C family protein [Candidatus Solirubrobacter pratensis]|uniref:5-oxoprolinase subunit C family protein n=1 Tax=Candidatus Solirubrobacter pratensis TaxID=1298857 RepID=UPI00041CB6DE|nr:biotin-dependent carboxyltransferase family protein [Candidatus Solirubrobacter pratensis]